MGWTIQAKNSCIQKTPLTSLLSQVEPQQRNIFVALSHFRIKSSIEQYSSEQAQNVYIWLVNKSKNQKERKNWKSDETNYLFFVLDKYCILNEIQPKNFETLDWQNISQYVPGRSGNDCKFRFMAMTPNSLANAPWICQQKQLLMRIIQNQKSNSLNWKKISQKLYELSPTKHYRTGKQCRQQYTCFLNPNLKKGTWTVIQDYELICLFEKYGRKWSLIAKEMQGRNENAIKNRFFLLFQQKKMLNLSNSDLNKRIKRKKQKIEKEQLLRQQECGSFQEILPKSSEQNTSKRAEETQRSSFQDSEEQLNQQSSIQANIFVEQSSPVYFPNEERIIVQEQSECIFRYINF